MAKSNLDTAEIVREEAPVENPQQPEKLDDYELHPGQAVLERFINLPSSVNFEVIVQIAWESVATTFQFSLSNGGPVSMVYGTILAAFGASAVAMSLAEMASIDPIVGAQYRWSANFAPFAPRFWGLIQGWISVFAWMFSAAAAVAILANTVVALIIFNNPDYTPERWHIAMIMWAFILIPVVFNLFFRRVLNTFETIGAVIHIVVLIATIITLAVLARRSSNDFVWKKLVTDISGWSNPGVAFGIGLLTVVFPLGGADGVLHMSAEVKSVRTRAPISIITATMSNAIMQFAFVVCLLYTIGDLDKVTSTPTGLPMIEVYYLATNSVAATNTFLIAIIVVLVVAVFNVFASVSRLTWAFARDDGLSFSRTFAKVNPRFKMPLNALWLVAAVCMILSLIYIGSSTAFNAIISLFALGLHVSYILPILFVLLRKIRGPPLAFGPFKLGRWGVPINMLSLAYLVFVIIWMPFPTIIPVTGSNMNYAGPILLIIIFGAIADWVISGHKRFEFPVAQYIHYE